MNKTNKTYESILKEVKDLEWNVDCSKIIKLIKTCIKITPKSTNTVQTIGKSKFGGQPDLPEGYSWPEIQGVPLAFAGQINFSELEKFKAFDPLFKNRIIFFFFSIAYEHHGEESPIIHKTIMLEIDQKKTSLKAAPFPQGLKEEGKFKEVELEFKESFSFPSYQHWKILSLNLSDNDEALLDEVDEIIHKYTKQSYSIGHQLFGYAHAIQGDTNFNWAKKHKINQNDTEEVVNIQKQFELLLQIDADDKGIDFNEAINGGIYYGYKKTLNIPIECELQNT